MFETYGYNIVRILFDALNDKFNKSSNEDKVLYFIVHPAMFFIKGTDIDIHNSNMSIIDFNKNVLSDIKPISQLSLKTNIDSIAKDLTLKFIFSKRTNRINTLELFYKNEQLLIFRFSGRNLNSVKLRRLQLYIESGAITTLEKIINLLAHDQ